jgi:hypothetical protein
MLKTSTALSFILYLTTSSSMGVINFRTPENGKTAVSKIKALWKKWG